MNILISYEDSSVQNVIKIVEEQDLCVATSAQELLTDHVTIYPSFIPNVLILIIYLTVLKLLKKTFARFCFILCPGLVQKM